MKEDNIACTGLQCPLKHYCENFKNHEFKNTRVYVMADFDVTNKKCMNFTYKK